MHGTKWSQKFENYYLSLEVPLKYERFCIWDEACCCTKLPEIFTPISRCVCARVFFFLFSCVHGFFLFHYWRFTRLCTKNLALFGNVLVCVWVCRIFGRLCIYSRCFSVHVCIVCQFSVKRTSLSPPFTITFIAYALKHIDIWTQPTRAYNSARVTFFLLSSARRLHCTSPSLCPIR